MLDCCFGYSQPSVSDCRLSISWSRTTSPGLDLSEPCDQQARWLQIFHAMPDFRRLRLMSYLFPRASAYASSSGASTVHVLADISNTRGRRRSRPNIKHVGS